MLIINNIQVTKRDMEDLLNTITKIKKNVENGEEGQALFSLDVLKSHLAHNLLADEIKVKRDVA
jgi:hypothetical protein